MMRTKLSLVSFAVISMVIVGCSSGDDKPDSSVPVTQGNSSKLKKPSDTAGPGTTGTPGGASSVSTAAPGG